MLLSTAVGERAQGRVGLSGDPQPPFRRVRWGGAWQGGVTGLGGVACLQTLPAPSSLPRPGGKDGRAVELVKRPILPASPQARPMGSRTQSPGAFGQKGPQPTARFGPPASAGPSLLLSLRRSP